MLLCLLAMLPGVGAGAADEPASRPATQQVKTYIAVLDFAGGEAGERLADSLRLRLRRHEAFTVINRLTTQEMSGPVGAGAGRDDVLRLMTRRLGVNVAFYGTVRPQAEGLAVEARRLDLRSGEPEPFARTYTDDTERSRAVIVRDIVEDFTGQAEWTPPQYGDEEEPERFGPPLNANGGFEDGRAGWDHPDNVGTFLQRGPEGRGRILRIRTDLKRGPWLRYRRALRLGRADPTDPPSVGRDTGYGSVAGVEGVHYRGELMKARSGQRYWIVADHCGPGGAKVFVKGFRSSPKALDGLPESSLAERGLTARQFAALPDARRKRIIAADAKAHPMRYLLECYRTYLNCSGSDGEWKHFAKPFPPRGGLPENVEYLQIQVYCNWPPGDYLWDEVHLYKDPRQTAPLPEEPARTPNVRRGTDTAPAAESRPAE
jgi:TolB-like protein